MSLGVRNLSSPVHHTLCYVSVNSVRSERCIIRRFIIRTFHTEFLPLKNSAMKNMFRIGSSKLSRQYFSVKTGSLL